MGYQAAENPELRHLSSKFNTDPAFAPCPRYLERMASGMMSPICKT
ncbi:hypothetical protein HMPREF0201_02569 [Cedecea davisae DSM 4568]|uniref:Uncharacterized protein n=1 Tax=Cedecea davisae DSM 4568 TaxID=566551 RepID=S3JSS9_9ENTR|nr:hypothetical protein HMPREF0201_02569 [Cedecea davisae DSM 4568]